MIIWAIIPAPAPARPFATALDMPSPALAPTFGFPPWNYILYFTLFHSFNLLSLIFRKYSTVKSVNFSISVFFFTIADSYTRIDWVVTYEKQWTQWYMLISNLVTSEASWRTSIEHFWKKLRHGLFTLQSLGWACGQKIPDLFNYIYIYIFEIFIPN